MEEARNNLESYLYKLRDLLNDDSEAPFMKCSQPGERFAIQNKLDETLTWMHDEADNADTTQFLEKMSGLEYVPFVSFGDNVDSPFAGASSDQSLTGTRRSKSSPRPSTTPKCGTGLRDCSSPKRNRTLPLRLREAPRPDIPKLRSTLSRRY